MILLRSRLLFENEYIDTNRVKAWDFLWLLSDSMALKAPHYLSAEITTHIEALRIIKSIIARNLNCDVIQFSQDWRPSFDSKC